MPLTRYQIRNEYSLADPELYKAADRDDPEALLEGVAMAGLVGVLRQLGDLAELAAEIFHDLHEEVMATATRGHGLMARVQQLEAELPNIEKAFLSQTNHSLFFTNAGVDWHPNLHLEQNLITRGDLPRCVMDSYEECRGPPRLFLLDKFDVAGAGACLKRYTDPSFFKVEAAPSEIPSVEIQREKKIRKVKKKGSRWRNGETPEIVPTSHAKLHQLFLEERIEKGHSNPARLVKLKKRQLNASPFDSRFGRSYMEKFVETTPEQNVVRDISVTPLPLKMTSNNCSELGLDIHDISTVSPVKKSSRGNESACTSPDGHEVVVKPSMDELYGEVIDRQIVKVPEPSTADERDETPSSLHKVTIEKEIVVDEEGKTETSVDGHNSDDMTSEVDNYVDALTIMELEMETDNEYRHKTGLGFSNVEKHMMDSDRNREKLEFQAHSSDSQSIGNFSASDDGNSSFKKGRSSFSYSDTLSNLPENIPSDGEGSARVFPSSETSVTQFTVMPSNQLLLDVGVLGTKSHGLVLPNDVIIDEDNTCDLGDTSTNSSLIDSNPPLLALDPVETSLHQKLDETSSETTKPGSEFSHIHVRETNLDNSFAAASEMPSQTRDSTLFIVCAEGCPVDKLDAGDPNVFADDLLHLSNNSELDSEKENSNDSPYEKLQTDFAEENCSQNMVNNKIDSLHSITSPTKELVPCSALPEVEMHSGFTFLTDSSYVGKLDDLVSKVDDTFMETGVYRESSTSMVDISQNCSFKEQQVSDTMDNVPQGELDMAGKEALYSKEANLMDNSGPVDGEKIGVSTCKVEATEGDAVSFELPSNRTDSSVLQDHARRVQADNINVSSTVTNDVPAEASVDNDIETVVHPSPDIICSPSTDNVNLQESPYGTEDPHIEGLELNELFSQSFLGGSEAEKKMTQQEVAAKDFDSASFNLVSYDESNLEIVQGVCNLSLTEMTKNSLPDFTLAAASSELSGQGMESNSLHHSRLHQYGDNGSSLPTTPFADVDTSLEQSLQLQTDQLDVEFMKGEATSDSAMHLLDGIQSSDNTIHEILFNNASESCQKDLMNQPSPSECLQQSAGLEINNTKPEMDPLGSVFPSFGLFHEAAQPNLEEMPPLPPLPPMQWRIGKIQPAPLFSQREFSDHSQESCPSILPFGDHEKDQSGFPSQQRSMLQPLNPFLPVSAVEVEKLQYVPQREMDNEMQPTLSSLQFPSLASDASCQKNSLALEGTKSLNPFLPLSALPSEKPEYGFLVSKHEEVQSSSNPFLPLPGVEDTSSSKGHVSTPEKLIQHLNELEPEPGLGCKTLLGTPEGNPSDTSALLAGKFEEQPQPGLPSSEGKTLQQTPENSEEDRGNPDTSALPTGKVEEQPQLGLPSSEGTLQGPSENSEGECGNPSETSAQPPGKIEEQRQHVLSSSEGESAWLSNPFVLLPTSDIGKANVSSMVKRPRPRNPLMDAVAALDKSKLRKATERVWPQIGPKVDERDSLLEQIRTKSFNLKPAVVSRPSVEGPKTNLKVAAILEKANAIRQATAGSDEDDNEDWSDS